MLSQMEVVVHGFQNWIRNANPLARLALPPAPGDVVARNCEMAQEQSELKTV